MPCTVRIRVVATTIALPVLFKVGCRDAKRANQADEKLNASSQD